MGGSIHPERGQDLAGSASIDIGSLQASYLVGFNQVLDCKHAPLLRAHQRLYGNSVHASHCSKEDLRFH